MKPDEAVFDLYKFGPYSLVPPKKANTCSKYPFYVVEISKL